MTAWALYLLLLRAILTAFSGFASVPVVRDDLVVHRHVSTDGGINARVRDAHCTAASRFRSSSRLGKESAAPRAWRRAFGDQPAEGIDAEGISAHMKLLRDAGFVEAVDRSHLQKLVWALRQRDNCAVQDLRESRGKY
jgi:hypothetical protein